MDFSPILLWALEIHLSVRGKCCSVNVALFPFTLRIKEFSPRESVTDKNSFTQSPLIFVVKAAIHHNYLRCTYGQKSRTYSVRSDTSVFTHSTEFLFEQDALISHHFIIHNTTQAASRCFFARVSPQTQCAVVHKAAALGACSR